MTASLSVKDEMFLPLFKNGNGIAFKAIYSHTFDCIYNWCKVQYNTIAPEDIEDYIADAYLKLWENRGQMRDVKHIKNYLFFLVKNAQVNQWRMRLKHMSYFREEFRTPEYDAMGDGATFEELEEILRSGIRDLKPRIKQVIEMCFFKNKSLGEIASELNRPVRTIQHRRQQGIMYLLCLPYATKMERKRIYLTNTAY